jgi:hypothetical protein
MMAMAKPKAAAVTAKLVGSGEAVPGPNGTMIMHGDGVVFVTLPEMLVNITGPEGRPAYLKLKLTLEAPNDETVTALGEHIPRVTDQFNGFLRELRTEDLAGSAGAYRLRLGIAASRELGDCADAESMLCSSKRCWCSNER